MRDAQYIFFGIKDDYEYFFTCTRQYRVPIQLIYLVLPVNMRKTSLLQCCRLTRKMLHDQSGGCPAGCGMPSAF